VRELKGFRKVQLAPGQGMDVVFTLDRRCLAFSGRDGRYEAEPGLFELWVCASSASGEPVGFELLPQA
jgi:beta-glucosidase